MKEAVIVSTARTPIGLAFKGSLNNIKSPTLTAHAIRHAVDRAGVPLDAIDDVVIGSVLNAGTAGMNIARNASLAAGLPYSVQSFWLFSILFGCAVFGVVFLGANQPPIMAGAAGFAAMLGVPRWIVQYIRKRRQDKFLLEFAPLRVGIASMAMEWVLRLSGLGIL